MLINEKCNSKKVKESNYHDMTRSEPKSHLKPSLKTMSISYSSSGKVSAPGDPDLGHAILKVMKW